MEFIISAKTDRGIAREQNQDSYSARMYHTSLGNIVFAILCDGMGGLAQGELASASLVKGFCRWADERLSFFCEKEGMEQEIHREWVELIHRYNRKIQRYGELEGKKLGSTLTAILLTSHRFYIVHIGDTRVYEIGQEIRILTTDHTVVARAIEQGRIRMEEARENLRKNILWQCVGASKEIQPEFIVGDMKPDTIYLLCSDGFWHWIGKEEVAELKEASKRKEKKAMEERLASVMRRNRSRKEQDDMSAIVISTYL